VQEIVDSLLKLSDDQMDPRLHPYLRKWPNPVKAIEVLEVLDMAIHGSLASGFVISTFKALYDMALKREGTTNDRVVKLATWRKEKLGIEPEPEIRKAGTALVDTFVPRPGDRVTIVAIGPDDSYIAEGGIQRFNGRTGVVQKEVTATQYKLGQWLSLELILEGDAIDTEDDLNPTFFQVRVVPAEPTPADLAKERIRGALPHLKHAIKIAKRDAIKAGDTPTMVGFAVVATTADGRGHVSARFESEEFLRDLETLVGPVEEIDDLDAAAIDILSQLGL